MLEAAEFDLDPPAQLVQLDDLLRREVGRIQHAGQHEDFGLADAHLHQAQTQRSLLRLDHGLRPAEHAAVIESFVLGGFRQQADVGSHPHEKMAAAVPHLFPEVVADKARIPAEQRV